MKLYHNPRCSKSRQALSLLQDSEAEFEIIEYLKDPMTKEELENVIKLLGDDFSKLVRTKEELYKKSQFDTNDAKLVAEELSKLPALMERPLVVTETAAVIGRPPELIQKLLN